ncbi:MAG: hypothetical protein OEL19_10005 [Sulfurimonas sp.]|nr:hypothetical protein [Sulfurimonas sp.]
MKKKVKMSSIKLIIHIGAGKTGTSSIQQTLMSNREALLNQGFFYLGLMLENANEKLYDWQKASAIESFHSLTEKETEEQLFAVLDSAIKFAAQKNIHTLIWSNESLYGRTQKLYKVLQTLKKDGVEIEFIAYIRRHEPWARSAYVQWGIKHKINAGKLLTFREWMQKRAIVFYPQLESVMREFPNELKVRNMDAVGNTVKDFLELCNINYKDMAFIRSNESPSNEELLLRSLFNKEFKTDVLPNIFDRMVSPNIMFEKMLDEYMQDLMPTNEDFKQVSIQTSTDRSLINRLLQHQGQEPISENEYAAKPTQINSEKLLLGLCDIVMQQSIRIRRVEKMLKETLDLQQKSKSTEDEIDECS